MPGGSQAAAASRSARSRPMQAVLFAGSDPAPVIGGGRPPVIGERDREPPAGGFEDGADPVIDSQLRLEAEGDAPGEELLFA
jgi:hypothetical protein